MPKTPTDQLLTDLRRLDPERFTTLLLAPRKRQEGLLWLYGFNLELGRIRERTLHEPKTGLIRLYWWREAIEEGRSGSPLAEAVLKLELDRARLLAMIDAREADMEQEPKLTMAELEAYAEGTGGNLQALAAQWLGGDAKAQETAYHAGTAYALLGLMRALPAHIVLGRRHLPREAMACDFWGPSPELAAGVRKVAELAERRLEKADVASIPRPTRAAALCALQAATHLRRLQRARFDCFDTRLLIPATRPLALAWGMISK
ncbi:MAG: squalene/phytoene synthase family protein [Rhodospirillales bacterium]|nr:MAG: squalene/phytoene synthase family protein [Rhodospirillales bacterium]